MTINHYTRHQVNVENLIIHKLGGMFLVSARIEGLLCTSYFARKVGKKDAAKALASQYVERQQRLAAEAADPCKFL